MRRWLGTAGDSLREMISGAANCAGDVPSLAGPAVTGQSRANTSQECTAADPLGAAEILQRPSACARWVSANRMTLRWRDRNFMLRSVSTERALVLKLLCEARDGTVKLAWVCPTWQWGR